MKIMDGTKLLSEEFVQITSKIAALNEKKKELKAELKAYHEKVKAEIADLEVEATNLYNEFVGKNQE
jgi:hypothetical protein